MASSPPTKPPRGVKQGKETSGLLMSVIRTLSASETNEQREKERAKLEKEYKKSDGRLDELVSAHAQEILEVMQKYNQVMSSLTSWGVHCDAAVARLGACRGLLRLKRDDLKRLWTDARTHLHATQMCTNIEQVVVSERKAREALSAGRVLAAATALRRAAAMADTHLADVTALSTTRHHLEALKSEAVETIVRRIHEAVYVGEPAAMPRRLSARKVILAELTKNDEVTDADLQDITPELEASLSEEERSFETSVMICLEALGVLRQLREASEKFKVSIQEELLKVISRLSTRIIEQGADDLEAECDEDGELYSQEGVSESSALLAKLLASLREEIRACAARNKRLIQLWRAALQRHKLPDSGLHSEQHYWSAVQQVLQLLLTEYLQIESVTMSAQRAMTDTTENSTELRISDYFAKKRPQRRRPKLFKFTDGAVPPPAAVRAGGRLGALVAPPSPAHLHAILPTLLALTRDIEPQEPGGECSLRAFITDYVRTGESNRLLENARAEILQAVKNPSAWRERKLVPSTFNEPKLRTVFAVGSQWWQSVAAAVRVAARCGLCGGLAALRTVPAAMRHALPHARAAHARMQPSGASRAARWLADDDIARFLQSLPNWQHLSDAGAAPAMQELKQAYQREAEILGASLGDGAVRRTEVVTDVAALVELALLGETMDWLGANLRTVPALAGAAGGARLPDKLLQELQAAARAFEDIANKCLLFLHLEMRIQCFHYLGQEERTDEQEAGGAARLVHALLALHERAAVLVAPERLAYVLNGIGEMMSAGVVWNWQRAGAGAAGEAGGARLPALRHCLTALNLPHDALEPAENYERLLHCSPQEIIIQIREKGAQFSELEYMNALRVVGAKRELSPADLRDHMGALSAALGHVGVTV